MLNIPESIKELFKKDGVQKNFRVQFPNGELLDVTNDSVVQESVRFTESLCSRDVLRFGLTEASMIEFETVGVPNMYGMAIACSCEIDVSSLTAAQIGDIESGSYDGQLVTDEESDLGFAFYRVPYGVFRVESCPRNHGAMTHRKVTAYTVIGRQTLENPVETAKSRLLLPGNTYEPDPWLLILSALGYKSEGFVKAQGYTKTEMPEDARPGSLIPTVEKTSTLKKADGSDIRVIASADYRRYTVGTSSNTLYAIDTHGFAYESVIAAAMDVLSNAGADPQQSGYSTLREMAIDCFTSEAWNAIYPAIHYSASKTSGSSSVYYGTIGTISITESNHAIYPYRAWDGGSLSVNITAPENYALVFPDAGDDWLHILPSPSVRPTVYSYDAAPTAGLSVTFDSTLEQTRSFGQLGNLDCYSFANAYSLHDLVNAYLELHAMFGKAERDGSYSMRHLSDGQQQDLIPADYRELWWDEYTIADIGSVVYQLRQGEEYQTVTYSFGDGESVYDMTQNAILKNLKGGSQETVNQLLAERFVPHVNSIAFTPADLEAVGQPYLEAGDWLSVTAEDGTVVGTYCMRRELTGIQVLEDSIESASGEIITIEEDG